MIFLYGVSIIDNTNSTNSIISNRYFCPYLTPRRGTHHEPALAGVVLITI